MLVLGVTDGQEIVIGEDIVIRVKKTFRGGMKVAIEAPKEVPITRRSTKGGDD